MQDLTFSKSFVMKDRSWLAKGERRVNERRKVSDEQRKFATERGEGENEIDRYAVERSSLSSKHTANILPHPTNTLISHHRRVRNPAARLGIEWP
jgi:hypothetical protein